MWESKRRVPHTFAFLANVWVQLPLRESPVEIRSDNAGLQVEIQPFIRIEAGRATLPFCVEPKPHPLHPIEKWR